MSSQSSPLEYRRTTLKEFAEEQLAAIDTKKGVDGGLTVRMLMDRFETQSGRCSLSSIKLRLERGFFNSAVVWKPITGDQYFDGVQYIAAGVAAIVHAGFNFDDALEHIRGMLHVHDLFFKPNDMFDPCVQASIHAEYQLETKGLLIQRSGGRTFTVARTADSLRFHIDVVEKEAIIRISALESSMSGKRIIPSLPTDNFWTTTSNGNTTVTASIGKVNVPALSNTTTATNITRQTGSQWFARNIDLDMPDYSMKEKYPDRTAFRESAIVEIPLADPRLFDKVVSHVFRLIEKSRDFGPLEGNVESI